jgi:hypothetical protein
VPVHSTWRVSLKRIPTRRGGVSVRAETISPPSDIGFRWQMRFHGSRVRRALRGQHMKRRWRGSASGSGMPSRTAELAAEREIGEAIPQGEFVPCDPWRG